MKNFKKIVLAAAVCATFFNNCEVMAAEKNVVSSEVQNSESTSQKDNPKKISEKKEIKAVNSRIDELDEKIEEQQAIQKKILEMLENLRTARVKGASEENISYNPAALVRSIFHRNAGFSSRHRCRPMLSGPSEK